MIHTLCPAIVDRAGSTLTIVTLTTALGWLGKRSCIPQQQISNTAGRVSTEPSKFAPLPALSRPFRRPCGANLAPAKEAPASVGTADQPQKKLCPARHHFAKKSSFHSTLDTAVKARPATQIFRLKVYHGEQSKPCSAIIIRTVVLS